MAWNKHDTNLIICIGFFLLCVIGLLICNKVIVRVLDEPTVAIGMLTVGAPTVTGPVGDKIINTFASPIVKKIAGGPLDIVRIILVLGMTACFAGGSYCLSRSINTK